MEANRGAMVMALGGSQQGRHGDGAGWKPTECPDGWTGAKGCLLKKKLLDMAQSSLLINYSATPGLINYCSKYYYS